jgi:hypothetical protein
MPALSMTAQAVALARHCFNQDDDGRSKRLPDGHNIHFGYILSSGVCKPRHSFGRPLMRPTFSKARSRQINGLA